MYKNWVLDPAAKIHVSEGRQLFRLAGFNGCIASSDETRVGILNSACWTTILHT